MPRPHTLLTPQLRELEHDKLVTRTMYHEMLPKVEETLSEFRQTLGPMLQMLAKWGTQDREQIASIIKSDQQLMPVE